MKKKIMILLTTVFLAFGFAGCGGAAEEAPKEEQQAQEEAEGTEEEETPLNEEQTEDINAWFQEMYGDEYGPEWYEDVTDIRITDLGDGKRSLIIESANADESVASSMAMIIWGYDDTIEFVSVYDQEGNRLFSN